MKTKKKEVRPLVAWAKKIGWERRVKAVCKPCWEIKYCPYGNLVENFPLKTTRDEKSCRIFGHDCPVFSVAEPLTETKELRRINRSIPRATQLRVLKRENQICSECGKSVKDEDIEFDHIIPWSKGGSSDENNIRLLCKSCNRRKGKNYEDKCLVQSITEHVIEPIGIEVAYRFLGFLRLSHEYFEEHREYPSASDICSLCGTRKVRNEHEMLAREIQTINEFFVSDKPAEIKQRDFLALKYRWGFSDRQVHKLEEAANKYRMDAEEFLSLEINFVKRLGWNVQLNEKAKREWLSL